MLKKNLSTQKKLSIQNVHKKIFYTQLVLIITLALFLGVSGTMINLHFEVQKRDQNLQNIAEAVASSPLLDENINDTFNEYLDSLKTSLDSIDVISVVSKDNIRLYHSNHALIGTEYDGNVPLFQGDTREYAVVNETGPSGSQRRAYAAVYDKDGNYNGFVMAIMLLENVHAETVQILFIFALITLAAVLMELMISAELSASIRKSLHGYEPNVFSAMFQIRDNILESLNEGVVAIDKSGIVQFANQSAAAMLGRKSTNALMHTPLSGCCNDSFARTVMATGEKTFNIQERSLGNTDVLIDCVPIKEGEATVGAAVILHNREEYTKLMEDLAGTRYLVDSMRANNHDFTNKLHVILGLIQMEMYDEAVAYIENISMVQRETVSKVMSVVDEPAIAALLIGKIARASELNVKFVLQEESHYSKKDMTLPSELMVTVIGNLIDNAYEAMNIKETRQHQLQFGIYSRPGAVLLTVADTGVGIGKEQLAHIFKNGFSTKGVGRGTGLYQVKELVEGVGGKITVESEEKVGTTFSVSIEKEGEAACIRS